MLFSYNFDYNVRLTGAEKERVDQLFEPRVINWHKEEKEGQPSMWLTYDNFISTLDVALDLGVQLRDLKRITFPGMPERMLDDRVFEMLKQAAGLNYNKIVNVHVPGDALLKIDNVMVLEGACTDNVQGYLNEGWRIMAVCPQPQRRPDYILGRCNNAQ